MTPSLTLTVEPYQIPAGFWDYPFTYIFDASGLTDGSNYVNNELSLIFQGDSDFVLRHIMGLKNVLDTFANGGRWSFRTPNKNYAIGRPNLLAGPTKHHAVLPEYRYDSNGTIFFDLQTVLRRARVGTNYVSQIAFAGVKRYPLPSWLGDTRYPYRELPYSFPYTLALNFAATASARPQYVDVNQYDFLLQNIFITQVGATGGLATDDFQILLYDAWNRQTSSVPQNQSFVNACRLAPQTPATYDACFPTPALLYPAGSRIRFDIINRLNITTNSYQILFNGTWRIPK